MMFKLLGFEFVLSLVTGFKTPRCLKPIPN